MANVLTRRLLNKNLFKLKDIINITAHSRCTSVFLHGFNYSNKFQHKSLQYSVIKTCPSQLYSTKKDKPPKLSIFQRFKQMYKDYWYVLVPVHAVTSTVWFGGFYYLAKSGVDIIAILQYMHISEKITNPLQDSSMGYIAVAYALYKIATPARYTVTLGGTTISINYLKKWGYIKPVPSTERLKEMVIERKDNFMESMRETREGLKIQSEKLKDKKENIIEDFDKSIKQIKELGEKMKSKEHIEDLKKIKKVKD